MNIKNLHKFNFLDRPTNENFLKAFEEIISIGGFDSKVRSFNIWLN